MHTRPTPLPLKQLWLTLVIVLGVAPPTDSDMKQLRSPLQVAGDCRKASEQNQRDVMNHLMRMQRPVYAAQRSLFPSWSGIWQISKSQVILSTQRSALLWQPRKPQVMHSTQSSAPPWQHESCYGSIGHTFRARCLQRTRGLGAADQKIPGRAHGRQQ